MLTVRAGEKDRRRGRVGVLAREERDVRGRERGVALERAVALSRLFVGLHGRHKAIFYLS